MIYRVTSQIAKRNVDKLLNEEDVYLEFSDLDEALSFIQKAKGLDVSSITIL